MKDKSNDSGSPACAVEPPRFTDFGLLTEAFNQGSLLNFAYRLAKGLTIDAKRIAAIKARNTNWREHKTFCGYCDDFENGAISKQREHACLTMELIKQEEAYALSRQRLP